jgi:hypothetical protein
MIKLVEELLETLLLGPPEQPTLDEALVEIIL